MKMETCIMVPSKKVSSMERVSNYSLMETCMKVNGPMA